MKWLQGRVVFLVGSVILRMMTLVVGGQKIEEKTSTSLQCASFLLATSGSPSEKGNGGDTSCEACLKNHCQWNYQNGRCVAACDEDGDGPCYSLQQQDHHHHHHRESAPSGFNNIGRTVQQICTEAKTNQQRIQELDSSLSSSSSLALEEGDKKKKIIFQREILETSNATTSTSTTTTTTTTNDDDDDDDANEEEVDFSFSTNNNYESFCQEITECISCYGNPTCTWKNGTCFSEITSGSDSSSSTAIKNRTVSAEVFCTTSTNYDDDELLQIFNDVVAAVEKAKEEDEMMEEEEESVGVDATADETTNDEEDSEQQLAENSEGGDVLTPGTVTVAATGTAGTVTVTSAAAAAAASKTTTATSQLWFLATAFLVVAPHF